MEHPIRLAARSARAHLGRYAFVIAVLGLGFGFITVVSSVSDGMKRSLTNAALRHYAGHVLVMGRDKDARSMMVVDQPQVALDAVRRSGAPVEQIITRAHEYADATVFFQGDAVRLKDLFGVNFSDERELFDGFAYAEGRFDPEWSDDVIVISQPTAEKLGARVGDRVTVRLSNRSGQVDTRTLVVAAVTTDRSIYGYARAYADRETVAALMGLQPGQYSVAGVLLADSGEAERWSGRIRAELAKSLSVSAEIADRSDLTEAFSASWEGVRYFVFPLSAYIGEVTNLLVAMEAASYGLLAMIVLVVCAAVVVTYRVILHDRTRELGTMLAIGFPRAWIARMLFDEVMLVMLVSISGGLLLSVAVTSLLSGLSFAAIPGFEIFMYQGRLAAHYRLVAVATNVSLVLAAVGLVVAAMVVDHMRRRIPQLLRGQTT